MNSQELKDFLEHNRKVAEESKKGFEKALERAKESQDRIRKLL